MLSSSWNEWVAWYGLSLTNTHWLLAHLLVFFHAFTAGLWASFFQWFSFLPFLLLRCFVCPSPVISIYFFFCESFLPTVFFESSFMYFFVRRCDLLFTDKRRCCRTWSVFCVESISAWFWMSNLNGEGITKLIFQDHSDFPDIFIHWLKQKHLKIMIF